MDPLYGVFLHILGLKLSHMKLTCTLVKLYQWAYVRVYIDETGVGYSQKITLKLLQYN